MVKIVHVVRFEMSGLLLMIGKRGFQSFVRKKDLTRVLF